MRNPIAYIGKKPAVLVGLTIAFLFSIRNPLFAQYYDPMAQWVGWTDAVIYSDIGDYPAPEPPVNKPLVIQDPVTGQTTFKLQLSPIGYNRSATAKIIEVLKGDLQILYIRFMVNYEELGTGKYVILLRERSNGYWEEAGVYSEDAVPKMRCLLPILEEKTETVRIQKLVDLIQAPSAVCPQVDWKWTVDGSETDYQNRNKDRQNPASLEALNDDVLFEIKKIRDPASFDIVAKSADGFPGSSQNALLDWIVSTGDPRAVPVLIKYLDFDDSVLRNTAARGLRRHFPGAPGVTEAFRERWKTADKAVRSEAVEYLMIREPGPELQKAYEELHPRPDITDPSLSFSQKARLAFRDGPIDEARQYCIQVIEDESLNDRTRLGLMDCVATAFNTEDRDLYLPAAAPFLERMVSARNSYASFQAIKIVLSVKHPSMQQALAGYLSREDTFLIWREDAYRAVMALRDLGEEARATGASVLLDGIENGSYSNTSNIGHAVQQLNALLWIGTDRDFYQAKEFILKYVSEYYGKYVADLRPLSEIDDEGAFWVDLLEKYPNQAFAYSLNWFYMRLGQLRDVRATPLLLRCLEAQNAYFSMEVVTKSLVQLGEPAISGIFAKLKELDLTDYSFSNVFTALSDSLEERALPFLRELAQEKRRDLPDNVWGYFYQYGTAEDIALLSSLNDYWKFGPNTGLQNALAELREKFGYDLNGPIEKKTR